MWLLASTGIGGCFIVYYDSATQQVYTIDGREEAPDAYHPQIFCRDDACFPQPTDECDCQFVNQTIGFPEKIFGGLSVGVPGNVILCVYIFDIAQFENYNLI